MSATTPSSDRVRVDGKFFRLGEQKFCAKGVTYGPFALGEDKSHFPPRAQMERDFLQIRELGANTLRVYTIPPRWLLELAQAHGLKLLVDVPWWKNGCFLDSAETRATARKAVADAVAACAHHPAVFAFSVVNEIPPDLVRWSGAEKVAEFIDELVAVAKDVDPECLCTFANFPPTEFLQPRNLDFFTFNVYLHHPKPFDNYLARLQMIADTKPLLLGEFGVDSVREGEPAKCEMLRWQIETAFNCGVAGAVVFAFTDDWWKDGHQVLDWHFGVVTRERQAKDSFAVVRDAFKTAPHFPLPRCPKVSIVVASYNGGKTLPACLTSLERLNYPNYEVILVDDGSKDDTQQIVARYRMELEDRTVAKESGAQVSNLHDEAEQGRAGWTPALRPRFRCIRQVNLGLSVARNTGINASEGEIVAFTDSDCRADEDWLHYLVGDLLRSDFTGIGGHNFLPPEDGWIPTAVMASPGGPAHVMLTDRLAEHIPGCNMAFYKWALDEISGFDPIYRKAGDDVDVCWRLQQRGYKIGFSSAGFVWHYRRATVNAYLKQQRGYGEAEALLVRKHPEYFNDIGSSIWRGRIYTAAKIGVVTRAPIIYHGVFGSAFFQSIYAPAPSMFLMLMTSLEWHVLVTLPLMTLGVAGAGVKFPLLLPLGLASALASLTLCIVAGRQAEIPKAKRTFWSRPLVAWLFLVQPIMRGWARYSERLMLQQTPLSAHETLDTLDLKRRRDDRFELAGYWADYPLDRMEFLGTILRELDKQGWQNKTDNGWSEFDVEIYGSRWCHLRLITATEHHQGGKQMVRCRLNTGWSLLGRITFWAAFGLTLMISTTVGMLFPWLHCVWLLPLWLGWMLQTQQRDFRRILTVLLDEVAAKFHLTKVEKKS
ncbi:MAG: glycosyltransferase [Limisphaerales bacterium]|nr:MAG: glycosyltransferase [Limisphaerales bacterium]KAG0510741.1 MAG: glycosyltransferase [Limisphaerales bacterium]TXT52637.1 MAG: glycosyltransferase [Limisphaerales bacterium]